MGLPTQRVDSQPLLPDYAGPCVTGLVPALLGDPASAPAWMPEQVLEGGQVVMLVLDGLGWEQLQERRDIAPTLASMAGGPITTVAPSTTSCALTSITTGLPPGEHGLIGYRFPVHGEIFNVLRWSTLTGDARETVPPAKLQPVEPFLGQRPPVVTRAEYRQSGFTSAHLDGVRFWGYRTVATLVTEVERLLRQSEPFVFCYYDGLDKVAHEYGLGDHFTAELGFVDRVVDHMTSRLPSQAALLLTADHGQVDVGDAVFPVAPEVLAQCSMQSGEGRFRWLHARPGRVRELYETALSYHGDVAWVVSREEAISQGWFGPSVVESARARLGDVALVARDRIAFDDPQDTGPYRLIGRHGSLTSAEMLVPLLHAAG
jgi:predicted AlkP superfamily pyrophosphatase or phosphodiesterase